MTYKEMMWKHLADYKVSVLNVHSNGIWKKNGEEYPHILPFDHQQSNILEPYREEFWTWFRKQGIKLHPDFHHLSSSQAMCFNLFFPFLAEDGKYMELLGDVFGVPAGTIRRAEFEVVLEIAEETNFDFCITADSRVLFEVKLTESGFGGTKVRPSVLTKFEEVYAPKVHGKFGQEFCSCKTFLENYQIMRNVWNLGHDNGDRLIVLVPKANRSLDNGLDFLDACVSEDYRPRVKVMYLEDVVCAIEQSIPEGASRLKTHFALFRQKYLPPAL